MNYKFNESDVSLLKQIRCQGKEDHLFEFLSFAEKMFPNTDLGSPLIYGFEMRQKHTLYLAHSKNFHRAFLLLYGLTPQPKKLSNCGEIHDLVLMVNKDRDKMQSLVKELKSEYINATIVCPQYREPIQKSVLYKGISQSEHEKQMEEYLVAAGRRLLTLPLDHEPEPFKTDFSFR